MILKSERLAVVIDKSSKSLLIPVVKVFFQLSLNARIHVEELDLCKGNIRDEVLGYESAEGWSISNVGELWSDVSL